MPKHVYSFRLNDKLLAEIEEIKLRYKLTRTEVVTMLLSLGLKVFKEIEAHAFSSVVEEVVRNATSAKQESP